MIPSAATTPVCLPTAAIARTSGFTMVEMLVALVVLAVGMLGVAGLFTLSLRSGSGAISRMQAVNLASDIADRIRSNRRAGTSYAVTTTVSAPSTKCAGSTAANCTPAQMAADDIWRWQQQITNALPGATGTIGYVAGASATQPSTYTIRVQWVERGLATGETSSTQQYVLQIQAPEN